MSTTILAQKIQRIALQTIFSNFINYFLIQGSLPGGLGGINPRNPLQQQNQLQNLRPGQVESINTPDLGLIRLTNPDSNSFRGTDPGLTNNDPNALLTFGSLQDMITKQRLLAHQQRLQEINRGPAKQGKF